MPDNSNYHEFRFGRKWKLEDQASYLRGKRYNGEKQAVPNASGKNQHSEVGYQNDNQPKTHERLVEEYKVSPATIWRDGQYAAAVSPPIPPAPASEQSVLPGCAPVGCARERECTALAKFTKNVLETHGWRHPSLRGGVPAGETDVELK